MATTDYTHKTPSLHTAQDYDLWIIAGYGILSFIILATLYLASGGPGNDSAALAVTLALP